MSTSFPDVLFRLPTKTAAPWQVAGQLAQTGGKMLGGAGRGRGYLSAAGLGSSVGALAGAVAPGSHTDENGNTVTNSRVGGALRGAAGGAAVGAGARFVGGRTRQLVGNPLMAAGKEMEATGGPPSLHGVTGLGAKPKPAIDPTTGMPKEAALRLNRGDIYLVQDTNGAAFIGAYKGANAQSEAVFAVEAPGAPARDAAFDMTKLGHIHPLRRLDNEKIATSRADLPFTLEGRMLAEDYAFKVAKRQIPEAFKAHTFKSKASANGANAAEAGMPEDKTKGKGESAPAVDTSGDSLPKMRAKKK